MNKKKPILLVWAVAVVCLGGFTACGDDEPLPPDPTPVVPDPEPEPEPETPLRKSICPVVTSWR